jgi:hypothetical protein
LHDAAKETAVLLYSSGTDTFLEDMTRNADRIFLLRRRAKSYDKAYFESLSKSAEEPDHTRGLDMIKFAAETGG